MKRSGKAALGFLGCLLSLIFVLGAGVFSGAGSASWMLFPAFGAEEEAAQEPGAEASLPGMLTGLKAAGSGKGRVSLTWNEVPGAEGYLVYGKRGGSGAYGYIGLTTQGAVFHDEKAIFEDYNYYWVFAYVKDSTGKMLTGKCEKYVFAKGICPSVSSVKVTSSYLGVTLKMQETRGAEGYLIYGKTAKGPYGYLGMTEKTEWTHLNAPGNEYTFYWVFPYFKDAEGKIIPGAASAYVYGKRAPYTASVTNLTVEGREKSIFLSWDKHPHAEGYLVYRKVGPGSFEYRYMVTEPHFLDTTASTTEYNFYRVYPYRMEDGKLTAGRSLEYRYARAWEKIYPCGETTAKLNAEGVLYVTGEGRMADAEQVESYYGYRFYGAPWHAEKNMIKKIIFDPGITYIGRSLFQRCYDLTEIVMPTGLVEIAEYAFRECMSLTKVKMPEELLSIGRFAFSGCTALTEVSFGGKIQTIEVCSFRDTMLHHVVIPSSIRQIEEGAFPSSTEFQLPEGFYILEDGSGAWMNTVEVSGLRRYDYAFEVLEIVNREREAAGLSPLVMDETLLEGAMLRGAEISLGNEHLSHWRPNGRYGTSASPGAGLENIAWGYASPEAAMEGWMGSDGHRNAILSGADSIGVGCFVRNGRYYWVQHFGFSFGGASLTEASKRENREVTERILVLP